MLFDGDDGRAAAAVSARRCENDMSLESKSIERTVTSVERLRMRRIGPLYEMERRCATLPCCDDTDDDDDDDSVERGGGEREPLALSEAGPVAALPRDAAAVGGGVRVVRAALGAAFAAA